MGENILFKMDGPVFREGMPLHIVLVGLSDLQNIMDRTYLVLSGRQRITSTDRDHYKIIASEFRRGSFVADIGIALAVAQAAFPFAYQATPQNIWEYTKSAWELLKFVLTSKKEGKKVSIEETEGVVKVYNGDVTNIYNGPVVQIAKLAIPDYQSMSQLLEKGVDNISIGKRDTPKILLTQDNKELFKTPENLVSDEITIKCEIFDYNKYSNTGKLSIRTGEAIPEGKYPFAAKDPQDQAQYIQSMLKSQVTLKCLPETSEDSLGNTNVARLQVIDILT